MLEISVQNGFSPFKCHHGVSSIVWTKDGDVFKLSKRNSVERAKADYRKLRWWLKKHGFPEKLQPSQIFQCLHQDRIWTCVQQSIISGGTISQIGRERLMEHLKKTPRDVVFLRIMISIFLDRAKLRRLYPDLVGNPENQSIENAINLIIETESPNGRGLVLCDVGLSPHEDTLREYGENFFDSDNLTLYREKMLELLSIIRILQAKI